jgi:hypothetical protein
MNLLERLHPVYKDKLSVANLEYPHLIAKLSDELETTQYVTELKYGSILDLNTFCGILSSPFDYFIE